MKEQEKFIRTTAVNKVRQLKRFVKGVQGGSSASKTYSILAVEIDYCAKNPYTETSVVAESIPHLKRGAMRDFMKIMTVTGRFNAARWNATDFRYRFANGSYIEFFSADDDSKLRGARRDRLYMNEANNLTFHAYTELAARTKQSIILDWNPVNEFWFHTELMNDEDVDFLILTYKDNEACPQSAVNFIEKAKAKAETSDYWANWYKVYGLGQVGTLQGAIYDDFTIVEGFDTSEWRFIALGLDWGFSNDPTALVAVYKKGDAILVHELLYTQGLTNQDIAAKFKELGITRAWEVVADSAEPKSIEEIYRLGFNIKPAEKGPDSIRNGIDILKRYQLHVTQSSTNLIKELRSYTWATDKEGKNTGVPIDSFNHACDAMRYVALNKLRVSNSGKYVVV